ncbi:hypothetical protein PGIGA_G00088380 [Pangasianodon gigas]|uniref:Uncharacterized protein n=1 Tax=Pangasianodon gigas TaxID=30993 RepID=A0ACC5XBQ6_PANGG|nr:hypothetical protein [Pangasianodon gigas]
MKSAEKLIIIVCFLFQGVLCRDFSISLPESVEALRGLCVLIPCRFEIEEQYDADLQKDLTGIWFKDGTNHNYNQVFTSKLTKENKIEGEIIGDLHMKNCTTIFYNISESDSGEYYFRIKASGKLKYTYDSTSVDIRVRGVLCREFSISLPQSVEALRGLCVLIPCRFEIEEQYDADLQTDLTGIWIKGDPYNYNNKVFNSKVTKENKIEGEIIGDLHMKNCTTIFYNISESDSGEYYFRIKTSGKLKNTYRSSSVDIRVRDSPISPSITLYREDQGKVEDQNEVVEGTSVSLICSAPAPPCLLKPPTFTWNFLPEERRQEQNHNTSFSSSQLNFSATHLHHGVNFTCTATYQLQNKNKSAQSSLTLHVLYAPQVSPSSSCNSTQDLIVCSCEVHGNPSPKLEWRLSGQTPVSPSEVISIWEESASNTTLRSFISIRQSVKDMSTLQCVVSNKLGANTLLFNPIISDSPISPSITLYKEDQGKVEDQNEVVEGTSVSLICSSPVSCPSKLPTFTWNFLPEERRQEQNHNTSFSSSQLNFSATHLHHGVDFTCTATYQLQNKNTKSAQSSLTLHVLYAPQVSPSSSCNSTQDLIVCSCEVHGNPSPKLEWRLPIGGHIHPGGVSE